MFQLEYASLHTNIWGGGWPDCKNGRLLLKSPETIPQIFLPIVRSRVTILNKLLRTLCRISDKICKNIWEIHWRLHLRRTAKWLNTASFHRCSLQGEEGQAEVAPSLSLFASLKLWKQVNLVICITESTHVVVSNESRIRFLSFGYWCYIIQVWWGLPCHGFNNEWQ